MDGTSIKENEKHFRYGREYSVKVSYDIPKQYKMPDDKQFFLKVNDACYTLKKNADGNNYTSDADPEIDNDELTNEEKEALIQDLKKTLSVELNGRTLSITKTFPLTIYTAVDVALGKDDSEIKVTYSGKDGLQEYADEIIFDADADDIDSKDRNQLKITLKPNKLRKFLDEKTEKDEKAAEEDNNLKVTVDGEEKTNIEIKDGLLVIHQCGKIVTRSFDAGITTAKKGSPVTVSTFRNYYVHTEDGSGKTKDTENRLGGNDENQGENANKQLKCTYNYKVDFQWQNNNIKTQKEMNSQKIDLGINRWVCEVQDNNDKSVYAVSGSIIGFNDATDEPKEIELMKSCDSKKIATDLFGPKSGITISGMKLSESKDKNYITVKSNKISADKKFTKKIMAVKVTGIIYGNRNISLEKQPITVNVKTTLPAGKIWFKNKNKGRRINCYFSNNINKLAEKKNRKKYGIKSMEVKIKYSKSKSNKQKYFKTAPAAVKRYFQPTVAKKERYVTSRKKFAVKRFQAVIVYKTGSGTVTKKMKVTGKYK